MTTLIVIGAIIYAIINSVSEATGNKPKRKNKSTALFIITGLFGLWNGLWRRG